MTHDQILDYPCLRGEQALRPESMVVDGSMKAALIFFSQTGNTRKIALAMAEAFREYGHSVRTLALKDATQEDAIKGDLLGIGTPCFSNQSPTPVKTYLRALPPLAGKKAFVFATSSGAPGRVLYDLTSILRAKGAHVLGGFLSRGQVHHPAPHMIGQFPGRPNQEDLVRARHFATTIAEHVAAQRVDPIPGGRPDAVVFRQGFYEWTGTVISDRMSRFLLPEPKLNPVRCDHCNWCASECPMENISLRPYPILGDRCIRCYHCLTGCPQKAFSADWRFSDPFLMLLYNARFMRWFGDLNPGEELY